MGLRKILRFIIANISQNQVAVIYSPIHGNEVV